VDAEASSVFERFRGGNSNDGRRDDLIDARLAAARADWILQRESELRFESMQARFEARNSDNPLTWTDASLNPESMLRAEIGDAEYEMYLQANNRPTSVNISSVMASSPAENAGLRPGDEIVSYDGRRVFST
jgi:predicted metalloprotease with PDZ domain